MSVQMDLIVASPGGLASSVEILNAAHELEKTIKIKMSMTHAENLVERLIKDKWMSEVSPYLLTMLRLGNLINSLIFQSYKEIVSPKNFKSGR